MKRVALAGLALLTACMETVPEAPAAELIAQWGKDSGSLPPDYAWNYTVTFSADQKVTAEYCRGYQTTPPGCAKSVATLAPEQFSAFQAELAPIVADMAARPPRVTEDIPVGGGVTFVELYQNGASLKVPAFPAEADAPRVNAAIALLQRFTPEGLVDQAKSRAR